MTLLIVDDEPLSVEGIAATVAGSSLGFDLVYKAYSMKQAQECFQKNKIDILLSDIEMPRGSGIDLVQWVRDNQFDALCIFLTSFSRFEYASSAIKLQIFDYVLKPCENDKLTAVLSSAIDKVTEDRRKKEKEQSGEYWEDSYQARLGQFWQRILVNEIPSDCDHLKKEMEWQHLDSSLLHEMYYLLTLVLIPDDSMLEWKEEYSWKYALSNVISEILLAPPAFSYENIFSIVVPKKDFPIANRFYDACEKLVQTIHTILPAECIGYCSSACAITELNDMGQKLRAEYAEKYSYKSALFVKERSYTPHTPPSFSGEHWQEALIANQPGLILDDLRTYFSRPCHNQYYDSQTIQNLYHQLLHVVYDVLKTMNLTAPKGLIAENASSQTVVYRTIREFMNWAEKLTTEVAVQITEQNSSASMIHTLTTYIKEHLGNDLNRAELTQVVHLHPDYLSTVFHQKMGISLSEYVNQERLNKAKNLLLTTKLPVSEVAIGSGFPNISYFSKLFKEREGLTPLQYRKTHQS